MGYKVEYFWAQIVFLLEKGIFLGKLPNTTIVYILCPIMLQYLKKILKVGQIMRYEVLQFWAKSDTNHPFTLKGEFFKN